MSKYSGLKQQFSADPDLEELRLLIRRYPGTVSQLAREAGVAWGTIDAIDRGRTRYPFGITKIVVKAVCQAATQRHLKVVG